MKQTLGEDEYALQVALMVSRREDAPNTEARNDAGMEALAAMAQEGVARSAVAQRGDKHPVRGQGRKKPVALPIAAAASVSKGTSNTNDAARQILKRKREESTSKQNDDRKPAAVGGKRQETPEQDEDDSSEVDEEDEEYESEYDPE